MYLGDSSIEKLRESNLLDYELMSVLVNSGDEGKENCYKFSLSESFD